MPVYNGEPYLREAVESILNQTFTDFEFIIIDDGSTDRTWEILSNCAENDARIALYRNQENLKLIRTLNKGLALARGKYIARHDADDVALPERLAKQVAYLDSHDQVGLLGTAYYRLNSQWQHSLRQPPLIDTEIRWRLLFDNIWPHPTMMFRRQLFGRHEPFYQNYLHAEDYELWVRLLPRTRAATLAEPLVVVRDHNNSGIRATHREEVISMAMTVSSQQIKALLPERDLQQHEILALHRCLDAKNLNGHDGLVGGHLMFRLFEAFARQPQVEPAIVRELRKRWIKQILAASLKKFATPFGDLGKAFRRGSRLSRINPMRGKLTTSGKQPTVSVVMPVYNGEPYLREAVESILRQTCTDFEFIIIDDGSTDRTWEILSSYAENDARIALHRNQENLKLIRTLNKGLTMARGKYIARQDADDVSLPDRLAKQVAYLEHHQDVGLLGTDYYRLNSQGQRILRQPPPVHTKIRWHLLFGNIWCHPSMMFRRELVDTNELFHPEYVHVEDYELWTRLVKRTRAATLSEALVIYREHDNSICAQNRPEQTRMAMKVSAQELNALFSQHALTPFEIDALHRCYSAQQLSQHDMLIGGRLMFQILEAFEKEPDIDSRIVHDIRRRWIKRILAATSAKQPRDLWNSGLLASIFHHDALALLTAGFFYLPGRALRQINRCVKAIPLHNHAR